MKLRIWNRLALAAALLGTGLLTSCGDDRFPDYSYKMTVYVGGKAFSTVRHVEQEQVTSIIDSGGRTVKTSQQGEAVIMDLGNGQVVYALLSAVGNNRIGGEGFAVVSLTPFIPGKPALSDVDQAIKEYRDDQNRRSDGWDERAKEAQAMVQVVGAKDLPRTLPPRGNNPPMQAWPMFVTFADAKDPKTVREVQPSEIGVSRITIEITDEPVTTGIEGRLGWLPNYFDRQFSGERYQSLDDYNTNGLVALLSSSFFSVGNGLSPFDKDK